METTVGKQRSGGEGTTLQALLPDNKPQPDAQVDEWAIAEDLQKLMLATLTEREQNVLRMRYGLGDGKRRTLEEIGNGLHVTRERVRQIESRAFEKLRERRGNLQEYMNDLRG